MNLHPTSYRRGVRPEGFTLIEALLALSISAVVLAAVGGVFYGAMRLRDRTVAALEPISRVHPALTLLRRDLKGTMWPGGVMTGTFRCGALGSEFGGDAVGLQFSTTTGTMTDDEPFGEIQEVVYELRNSESGSRHAKDLFRSVNRNMLTTTLETPTAELVLSDVDRFEVSCYDGTTWQENWDTSLTQTNLPLAVRVQIELADDPADTLGTPAELRTYEILVPLMVQSPTNAVDSSSSETGTGTESTTQ